MKLVDEEETITEKPKESSAEPEEKPKKVEDKKAADKKLVDEKPKERSVEPEEEPKKVKDKKVAAKKLVDEEEKITEKPKEKSVEPEEKPKKKTTEAKRRSIGEKKPKEGEKPAVESVDETDHIQVDNVNEDDVKPASKPSSRRGSKKEKSPEKTAPSIEV